MHDPHVPVLAAHLGPGEPELVAQEVREERPRLDLGRCGASPLTRTETRTRGGAAAGGGGRRAEARAVEVGRRVAEAAHARPAWTSARRVSSATSARGWSPSTSVRGQRGGLGGGRAVAQGALGGRRAATRRGHAMPAARPRSPRVRRRARRPRPRRRSRRRVRAYSTNAVRAPGGSGGTSMRSAARAARARASRPPRAGRPAARRGPVVVTKRASSAASAHTSSARGSACATEPPTVPRERVAGCPTWRSAWRSSGQCSATSGAFERRLAHGRADPEHAVGAPDQARDAVDVHEPRGPHEPPVQQRHEALPAREHLRVVGRARATAASHESTATYSNGAGFTARLRVASHGEPGRGDTGRDAGPGSRRARRRRRGSSSTTSPWSTWTSSAWPVRRTVCALARAAVDGGAGVVVDLLEHGEDAVRRRGGGAGRAARPRSSQRLPDLLGGVRRVQVAPDHVRQRVGDRRRARRSRRSRRRPSRRAGSAATATPRTRWRSPGSRPR